MKMPKYILLSAAIIGLLAACTPKEAQSKKEQANTNEAGGYTEKLGTQTLAGTPYLTKGAQFMVEGVIISDEKTLEKHNLLNKGSEELAKYQVRITGNVDRYHCGPMEQCLSQGYIDFMREIKEISVTQ
jgi:hypothetical protein